MIYLKTFIFLIITLLLGKCTSSKITDKDIMGQWESKDAIIEFKENNLVVVKNYPLRLNNSSFEGNLNGEGTWELKGKNKIQITAANDKFIEGLLSYKIGIELHITKVGFFNSGSAIDYLYIIEGDPDLAKKYKFKRSQPKDRHQ